MSRLLSASLKNACGLRTGSSRFVLGKELRVSSSVNSRFALRSEKAKCASGICKENSASESLHLAINDTANRHALQEKVHVNMILQETALTIQHRANFYGMNRAATLWNRVILTYGFGGAWMARRQKCFYNPVIGLTRKQRAHRTRTFRKQFLGGWLDAPLR